MSISRCFLIVDGNNITWRAASVVGDAKLTSVGGRRLSTSMMDSMLAKRIREMKEDEWFDEVVPIVTFDLPNRIKTADEPDDAKINRWTFYRDYKANRRDDKTGLIHERNAWREAWSDRIINKGTVVLGHPGVEADDIMAYVANLISDNTDDDTSIALWTSDKDLMQCVNDNRRIFMYRKRRTPNGYVETHVDENEVLNEKGVPASKMRAQLSLLGDSADNYHGIMQYGGKRGVNVVNASDGTFMSLLDELLKDEEQRLAKKIKHGDVDWHSFSRNVTDQLERNWTLAGCGADYMNSTSTSEVNDALTPVL